jgi:hypothetical protein
VHTGGEVPLSVRSMRIAALQTTMRARGKTVSRSAGFAIRCARGPVLPCLFAPDRDPTTVPSSAFHLAVDHVEKIKDKAPLNAIRRILRVNLLFAKTVPGCEINSLQDFLTAAICYNSRPCPTFSGSGSECLFASFEDKKRKHSITFPGTFPYHPAVLMIALDETRKRTEPRRSNQMRR